MAVEHKDLDRANNPAGNHRLASYSQNSCNKKMLKNNSSGYKGVVTVYPRGLNGSIGYRAEISFEGKRVTTKTFETAGEASLVYRVMSEMLHGEFSRV
jgi:hypothetical protein